MTAPTHLSSVLLVSAVPLLHAKGAVMLDDQTCEGLERWAENFERVCFTGIAVGDGSGEAPGTTETTLSWRDVRDLGSADRIEVIALPSSYRVGSFARNFRAARTALGRKIGENRYLCFTLGALVGDWGAVASFEAIGQKRPFAVSFDRVEYEVIRNTLPAMPLRRRLKERATLPLMARLHHHLIAKSTLALFQGQECFEALGRFSPRPFRVYDTHTHATDRIGADALERKLRRLLSGAPLRIAYAGRAAEMKGPTEWLRAITHARRLGADLSAVWMGDGPMLDAMRAEVRRLDFGLQVHLPGFVGDRDALLAALRETDLFVFCHKTPESPRCLVEALVSGAPLIGFGSSYPRALVEAHGGGRFVPVGDVEGLGRLIADLDADRASLAELVLRSARDGEGFDEESVYRERGDLLKAHL